MVLRFLIIRADHFIGRGSLAPVVRIESGDPVATITRIAGDWGADLVIAGHHRDGFWSHWLRGSVTAELGDSLECSLLLAQKGVEDSELFPKT